MALITPGMVRSTGERKNVQTLPWTDLASSESESEKGGV